MGGGATAEAWRPPRRRRRREPQRRRGQRPWLALEGDRGPARAARDPCRRPSPEHRGCAPGSAAASSASRGCRRIGRNSPARVANRSGPPDRPQLDEHDVLGLELAPGAPGHRPPSRGAASDEPARDDLHGEAPWRLGGERRGDGDGGGRRAGGGVVARARRGGVDEAAEQEDQQRRRDQLDDADRGALGARQPRARAAGDHRQPEQEQPAAPGVPRRGRRRSMRASRLSRGASTPAVRTSSTRRPSGGGAATMTFWVARRAWSNDATGTPAASRRAASSAPAASPRPTAALPTATTLAAIPTAA